MGLLPDMLPGYTPLAGNTTFAEYNTPTTPGLDMLEIFEAAGRGELSALYVVGSNPISRYGVDPASLKDTFVVVQEMFLTETAQYADVILPAANLYEKSGSITNSYGDLQLVNKAADRAGVRTDFEMIVRIADKMGADMRKLVPFGKGTRADMGQSRGAQSGEADRHAVWLTAKTSSPSSAHSIPSQFLTRSSASFQATICCASSFSPVTTSTCSPPPLPTISCRSATAATLFFHRTIPSSPRARLAATPPCSPTCSRTRDFVHQQALPRLKPQPTD